MTLELTHVTWRLAAQASLVGKPLAPVTFNFPFKDRVIRVQARCNNVKPTWHTAGYLTQVITLSGAGTKVPLMSKRVLLNEQCIFVYPQAAKYFNLRLEPVRWVPSLAVTVWYSTVSVADADLLEALLMR